MSINKKDLIKRVAKRSELGNRVVEQVIEATLEEIYNSLKQGESVSLRNFGSFYINKKSNGIVFKFNPSQRLRKLFGWASTYKSEM